MDDAAKTEFVDSCDELDAPFQEIGDVINSAQSAVNHVNAKLDHTVHLIRAARSGKAVETAGDLTKAYECFTRAAKERDDAWSALEAASIK